MTPRDNRDALSVDGAASDRSVIVRVVRGAESRPKPGSFALVVGGASTRASSDADVPFDCATTSSQRCFLKFDVALGDGWDGEHPATLTYEDARGATASVAFALNPAYAAGSCAFDGGYECHDSFIEVAARRVRMDCNGKYSRRACSPIGRSGRCAFDAEREGDSFVAHYYTPDAVAKPDCLKRGGRWAAR